MRTSHGGMEKLSFSMSVYEINQFRRSHDEHKTYDSIA
jgi:hypothetical protein